MYGKPFELTDAVKATIVEAAKKGLLEKDIAAAIGLSQQHFSNVTKHKYPEIDELIEEGRRLGREILMNLSWEIIRNIRDPARAQEIQRLNRRLKTEEPESTGVDVNGRAVTEITFSVIEKKPAAPKAE